MKVGEFGLNRNAYFEAVKDFNDRLAKWCRDNSPSRSKLVGEVVNFQYADGFASYMVWDTKPLRLIHLGHGDGYRLQEFAERGLRTSDIQERVDRDKAWRRLMDEKKEQED